MKLSALFVICASCLQLARSKSEPSTVRESKQTAAAKLNSLSTTPKPEYQTIQQPQIHYQQQPQYQQQSQYQQQPQYHQLQYQQQPLPVQLQRPLQAQHVVVPQQQVVQYQPPAHLVQRAFLVPQQHNQPAMIIIAQPTYVPVQAGPTQQLLNYFHNNPQARYQFLHGNYQPQPVQQPAHSIGNYVVAVPAHYQPNLVAVPVHRQQLSQPQEAPTSSGESQSQLSPMQLSEIAHIASQQYSRINPATQAEAAQYQYQQQARAQQQVAAPAPVRSLPPIFTGFENFSPEQQEKIKAQLSAHFGAPLQQLPADKVPLGNQYSSKYQSNAQPGLDVDEFSPSEQVKTDASSPNVSNNRSTHYAKV